MAWVACGHARSADGHDGALRWRRAFSEWVAGVWWDRSGIGVGWTGWLGRAVRIGIESVGSR